jgi:hypothetical protein
MNEQLKELAVQAGMEWDTHIWCWLANPPHLERFAELVRQDYLRELRELKPVAWLTTEPFAQTGCSITTVTLHQQISGTPLYSLEVTK